MLRARQRPLVGVTGWRENVDNSNLCCALGTASFQRMAWPSAPAPEWARSALADRRSVAAERDQLFAASGLRVPGCSCMHG